MEKSSQLSRKRKLTKEESEESASDKDEYVYNLKKKGI
jgi:hypothetical protein